MHVSPGELLDLVEERAAATVRARIEDHLASGCESCKARLEEFRTLIDAMMTDRFPEPPAEVVAAAVRLFRRESLLDRIRERLGGLQEELGRMRFDSLQAAGTPAFAGARSVASGRRLRFEGAGLELDVLIERGGDGARLVGQVLSVGDDPGPARDLRYLVVAAGSIEAEGETDALGEFSAEVQVMTDLRIYLVARDRSVVFAIPPGGDPRP